MSGTFVRNIAFGIAELFIVTKVEGYVFVREPALL
jgi:hypothetical protein